MAHQNSSKENDNRVSVNKNLGFISFDQLKTLIDFKKLQTEIKGEEVFLFDEIADEMAYRISKYEDGNKSSQLRKYYDEVLMWDKKIKNPEQYFEYLPLIKMINAKVAYANGRGGNKPLVDKNFVDLIRHCLGQLKSPDKPENEDSKKKALATFTNFKLFFEAFMGFYKVYKPK